MLQNLLLKFQLDPTDELKVMIDLPDYILNPS
jgi:hypothetical protein